MGRKGKYELIIKFAGDSGDGVQLMGTRFAYDAMLEGLDLFTFPDFPAEIRAPQGSLAGVSGFQLRMGEGAIHTVGEAYDVLVAMNAAAFKNEFPRLKKGGLLLADEQGFSPRHLKLADYTINPLEEDALRNNYTCYILPITEQTRALLSTSPLTMKARDRAKNMFTLGLLYWLFQYPIQRGIAFLEDKFKRTPDLLETNKIVLKAGYHQGEILDMPSYYRYEEKTDKEAGIYRNISGNMALAYGLITASVKTGRSLFLGSYPITPASDILHQMSGLKQWGVKTFQAEDEIAAIGAALGAAYAGDIGVCTTSGPGMDLKTETIGLAVMLELPLIVVNVQRAGPATGMPTKVEQADLMQALYGRHGEAPLPVIAPKNPSDAFNIAYEACRIAIRFMIPVIVLSDANIGNGMQSWRVPEADHLPPIVFPQCNQAMPYQPYARDAYGARAWVLPGEQGREHRIGGLEKQDITGRVSYDGENHEKMLRLRAKKIEMLQQDIPHQIIEEGADGGKILLLGWGSTYGVLKETCRYFLSLKKSIAHTHIRYLHPFPLNLATLLSGFEKIIVAEINSGQLIKLLRAQFPQYHFIGYNESKGAPLSLTRMKEFVSREWSNQ